MTQDQFYTWLENPSTMDAASIPQLREVIKRYPYFQAAQMMLAKNLKDENHIDQLNQLQLAAIMVPDRKIFHDYLHDKKKRQIERVAEENDNAEAVESSVADIEPRFPDELIPEPIVYQLETAELPELPPKLEELEEEVPEPDELSFSEWLDYTESGKVDSDPAQKTEPKMGSPVSSRSTIDIIDHFLTHQNGVPRKRAEFFNPQKAGAKSQQEDFSVISETLANIYFEQEKYELAKQAYEALSLKYPEKSVYFAARLKEINEKLNSE